MNGFCNIVRCGVGICRGFGGWSSFCGDCRKGGLGKFLIVREVFAKGLEVGIGDLDLAAFVDADVEG